MKKKVLGLLLLFFSAFLLVACSSKNDMSGEYYLINEYFNELRVTITNDNSGSIDVDGTDYAIAEIYKDKQQLVVNANGRNYVVPYTYEDGVLTLTEDSMYGSSAEVSYYKKDSKACKEALKKNGYKAVGKYK
ncbi:hypothetical protein JG537_00185 [Streptococcus sp. SL1232]|uniref:hypothetical protein n=1 Tax=Streptococcus vicugnae TaxID=2740579 RepID=UPI0018F59E9B|nr:hypothetical protein [Streptococcus vicugnae]MBJ7540140.1 hypothetical protein [Streptococcus vicugnae]